MKPLLFLLILSLSTSLSATEVDRLLTEYEHIQTVTCQIRRTVSGSSRSIQFLSRIYWQNDNQLHVDNLTPIPRRIIADGSTFFSYVKGDPKGFSRPVAALSEDMAISLKKTPGTAMDHLLRLKGIPEKALESKDGLLQRGYDTGNRYVVLGFDDQNRLIQVDFFKSAECKEKTGTYKYSKFSEAAPGIWIPMLHEAQLSLGEENMFSETVQIDRFVANEPVAVSLFNPSVFFDKEVDFVDSFEKIYPK